MSASIGSAIIGAAAKQTIWLRMVDGSGSPTNLNALTSSVAVTVNGGTPTTYATSSMVWGYGSGSGQYWPSVVIFLNSQLTGTETVTVTTTSGWCTTAAGSATAQTAFPCTFASTTALTLPTTNLGLKTGTNLTQYQITYTPTAPHYANLALCQDYVGSGTIIPGMATGYGADSTTGYVNALGTATQVGMLLLKPPGGGHDSFGWPNGPVGPATWWVKWDGPDGYQLSSVNGDTVTYNSSLSNPSAGTGATRNYTITAQSGYRAPQLSLQCTATGTSNLNVWHTATGNDGTNKWDKGFLSRIAKRDFFRTMDAFYTLASTRYNQSYEPQVGQASLIAPVYNGPMGRLQASISGLSSYPDTESRYPSNRIAVQVTTASAHNLQEGMPITINGLETQGPHGNGKFDVYRPHPGNPFGEAISLPGTTSGGTSCVNAGTGSSLQFSGAFTLEFYVKCGTTGTQECLVSQYVPGTASGYRFEVLRQTTGEVVVNVWVDATGLHYANLRSFGTELNDSTNKHFIAVLCNGSQMELFIDGTAINSAFFSGGLNAFSDGTAPFIIGALGDGTLPFTGTIDELRFSSICRGDISTITSYGPFAFPFTNDSHTALLYHFDAQTTPDSSANAIPAYLQGATAPALVSSPWTGGSYSGFTNAMFFAGTGSGTDTSMANAGAHSALQFTGAFTVEFKFKLTGAAGNNNSFAFFGDVNIGSASYIFNIFQGTDNIIYTEIYTDNAGTTVQFTIPAITDTSLHDYRFSCDGTTGYLYKDGSLVTSGACAGLRAGADNLGVLSLGGRTDGSPIAVTMQDFRLSNTARSTGGSYTPATSPLTTDSNTVVLYNLSSATSGVADSSSHGNTGTLQGGTPPTFLAASPWYTGPSAPSIVGTVPIYLAYQNTFAAHVIDSTNYSFQAQGDGTFTPQAGDYLSSYTYSSGTQGYGFAVTQVGLSTLDAIDLSNAASTLRGKDVDLWYNFPTIGIDTYATWVGQQLAANLNNLDTTRHVYLEFGNELWNGRSILPYIVGEFAASGYLAPSAGLSPTQWIVQRAQHVLGLIKAQCSTAQAANIKWVLGGWNGQNSQTTGNWNYDITNDAIALGAPYPDYFAGAPYEWLSPNEAALDTLFDTIYSTNPSSFLDIAEAWINDPNDIPVNIAGFQAFLDSSGLTAHGTKMCFYEGGLTYLGWSSSTNAVPGSNYSALYSQYTARHQQIYYVYQKYLQQISPAYQLGTTYPTIYADFNFADPPEDEPAVGTAMWGKATNYKDVDNYGTGVSPSLYKNSTNPFDLINLEDVASKAMDDWVAMGTGASGALNSVSTLSGTLTYTGAGGNVAGSLNSVSTLSGTVAATYALAGALNSVSTLSGTIRYTHPGSSSGSFTLLGM
jgi:hypothetical protein